MRPSPLSFLLPALLLSAAVATAQEPSIDSTAIDTVIIDGLSHRADIANERRRMTWLLGFGGIYGVYPAGGGLMARLCVPIHAVSGLRLSLDGWFRYHYFTDDDDSVGMHSGLSLDATYQLFWFGQQRSGVYARAGVTRGVDPVTPLMRDAVSTYGADLGLGMNYAPHAEFNMLYYLDLRAVISRVPHMEVMFGVCGW